MKPGSVYLGEVKFKKGNGDTYVLDLVPAVVNGTSCYKNILKDNDNLSTDNGDLVAFNL